MINGWVDGWLDDGWMDNVGAVFSVTAVDFTAKYWRIASSLSQQCRKRTTCSPPAELTRPS